MQCIEAHQEIKNSSSSKTIERSKSSRGHGTNSTISNQLVNYYKLDTSNHVRADEPGRKYNKHKVKARPDNRKTKYNADIELKRPIISEVKTISKHYQDKSINNKWHRISVVYQSDLVVTTASKHYDYEIQRSSVHDKNNKSTKKRKVDHPEISYLIICDTKGKHNTVDYTLLPVDILAYKIQQRGTNKKDTKCSGKAKLAEKETKYNKQSQKAQFIVVDNNLNKEKDYQGLAQYLKTYRQMSHIQDDRSESESSESSESGNDD